MEERFESLPDLLREIGKRQSKLQSKNNVLDPLPPHQSKSGQKKKKKKKRPFFFIISILSLQTLQVWSSVAWRSILKKKKRKKKPKKKHIQNRGISNTRRRKQINNASTTVYSKKTEPEPEAIPKFRAVYMRQKTHTQTRSIDQSVREEEGLLIILSPQNSLENKEAKMMTMMMHQVV
jgi:mannitol-specific phosphotransferase system IIBC component